MKRAAQVVRRVFAGGLSTAGSFALWTLWLVLGVALGGQLYIATTSSLTVPDFLIRQTEQRLAAAGLRASFQRTALDPGGRVLLEEVQLAPLGYSDPVLKARALYVEANPWLLAVGRFEPKEIRLIGASLIVPAMVSGTGAPVELVRDLEATLRPGPRAIEVVQFTARAAHAVITARGTLPLPRAGERAPLALGEFFTQRFPGYGRQAIAFAAQTAALQDPVLHLELAPGESGAPGADVTFSAAGLALEQPVAVRASDLRVETRVLLLGNAPQVSRLLASVREVRSPLAGGVTAERMRAEVFGRLEGKSFEPRSLDLAIEALTVAGVPAHAVAAQIYPRPLPRVEADVTAVVAGSPLRVRAEADGAAKTAALAFAGGVSPRILDAISARTKAEVQRHFDFDRAEILQGTARFGANWHFDGAEAHVALGAIRARGVTFNEGRATVRFDGRRFFAPEAYARIGPNFARGTYEHELGTHRYRFLLQGRLRPMDISTWFAPWWANFFRDYEFPAAPPEASVEVAGRWRQGAETSVFVFADAGPAVLRGAKFDHVRTRLFVRPVFFDGLELRGRLGDGTLRGGFTLTLNPETRAWRTLDLDAESSLPLDIARRMIGPAGEKILAPFELANAPEVRLRGHFDGPGSAAGRHADVSLVAASSGEFRLFDFPLQDVSFRARVKDDEIAVDDIAARVAGGTTTGKARIWGAGNERQLGFDGHLKDASLGQVVATVQGFAARRKGLPPPPAGKFVQEKANVRMDLAASAQGRLNDLFSYQGAGFAILSGAEIGEVPLLGGLSEVLKFTTLRFTSARANFKIEGPKLAFAEVAFRGANSAIDAHGDYLLDRRELDFNARILPFHESGNLIKSVVGAVLTPLSNVFEVKLTGPLEKPVWELALGYRAPDKPDPPKTDGMPPTVPAPSKTEAAPAPTT